MILKKIDALISMICLISSALNLTTKTSSVPNAKIITIFLIIIKFAVKMVLIIISNKNNVFC